MLAGFAGFLKGLAGAQTLGGGVSVLAFVFKSPGLGVNPEVVDRRLYFPGFGLDT